MGDLASVASTFWELFVLRPSGQGWTLVTPPGVADNGGLVMGPTSAATFVVGFEASQLLGFSPLALSRDAGRDWSAGVLPVDLAEEPDALAVSAKGGVLALVRPGQGSVLSGNTGLSSWHALVGPRALADSGGAAGCTPSALTAVAYSPDGDPLVGSACTSHGRVGIFEDESGTWQSVGPSVSAARSGDTTEVLRLDVAGSRTTALVAVRSSGTTALFLESQKSIGSPWVASVGERVPSGGKISATGTTPAGGDVVCLSGPGGAHAIVAEPGAPAWSTLPTLPPRTATVALGPDGRVDALAVSGSTMTDYELMAHPPAWTRVRTVTVPIDYHSSS